MDDTRTARLMGEIVAMITSAPGGVTRSEIRSVMNRHGYRDASALESILASVGARCPIWEEKDDEGETWYHESRADDRPRKEGPKPMKQPKKGDPQVAVSPEVMRVLRHYVADHGGTIKDAVERAVRLMTEVARA